MLSDNAANCLMQVSPVYTFISSIKLKRRREFCRRWICQMTAIRQGLGYRVEGVGGWGGFVP